MSEFRPPERPSVLRVALALLIPLILVVPLGGLVAIVLGMSPATYTIADGALTVRSGDLLSGSRTVRLSDVAEARVVNLGSGRRVAGTALPGFCGGHFRYTDLGDVWQATTCSSRGVLVRAVGAELPIVVSPPNADVFLEALRGGIPMHVTLPPPEMGPLWIVALVVGPLALVGIVVLPVLLLVGPGRMRYLVEGGRLEVITLFGRQSWPTRGARARPYTPGRMLRVGGTAAPGYYTGRYRESGQPTRVYATDVKQMVLFEGEARVLVSPEDREGFLKALEGAGVEVGG